MGSREVGEDDDEAYRWSELKEADRSGFVKS
jgi:hypothetical protein